MIPKIRLHPKNDRPVRPDGRYVVYWMNAARRPVWNYGLEYAVAKAVELGKPLIVVEALSCSYPWASDRHHAFVMDGMAANAKHFAGTAVSYFPYVEAQLGAGRGLHMALAEDACLYVTDEWPCFIVPAWVAKVAAQVAVSMIAVDSSGLWPIAATERVFTTAYSFRAHLQKNLVPHLFDAPRPDPLSGVRLPPLEIPRRILDRWQPYDPVLGHRLLAELPIDHDVSVVVDHPGGFRAGAEKLKIFVNERLAGYAERSRVDKSLASGLSGHLHYGHTSPHEILASIADHEGWSPNDLDETGAGGKRQGWWSLSAAAEGFMDELVTWRELGLNFGHLRPETYDRFDSLPDWARKTMAEHQADERPTTYTAKQFEEAQTHDELWNAAQVQLRREGIIQNYLRMLWGKKIYHWSKTPREALDTMIELNNRWAIDGRDPNSYSGIFWVLGRYDRAWGPEREIFGKLRYMTSESTARKFRTKDYVERYSPAKQPKLFE